MLRFEKGNYQAARDDFDGAIKADPKLVYAYHNRASA